MVHAMKAQIPPSYQVHFSNLETDPEFEKAAGLKLVQLLPSAPLGARAIGTLEKIPGFYVFSIKIFSPHRTFEQRATGNAPIFALHRAVERMEDQLHRWRFGHDGQSQPAVRRIGGIV